MQTLNNPNPSQAHLSRWFFGGSLPLASKLTLLRYPLCGDTPQRPAYSQALQALLRSRLGLSLIFALISLVFLFSACSKSLSINDPAGGSWKIADDRGFSFEGKRAESIFKGRAYRVIATTGWVEGKAIIAACECARAPQNCQCEENDYLYALINEAGEFEIPFGAFDFVTFRFIDAREILGKLSKNERTKGIKSPIYELRSKNFSKSPYPLWAQLHFSDEKQIQRRQLKSLFPPQGAVVWSHESEGFGFMDQSANLRIPAQFQALGFSKNGSRIFALKGNEFGEINSDGKFESDGVSCVYIYDKATGLSKANMGGELKDLKKDARMEMMTYVSPDLRESTSNSDENTFCAGGEWGLFSLKGPKSEFEYKTIKETNVNSTFFATKDNKNWGILDNAGNLLIDAKYDKLYSCSRNQSFTAKKGNSFEIFNRNGQNLMRNIEDFKYSDSLIFFKSNNLWGIADYKTHIIVASRFEQISGIQSKVCDNYLEDTFIYKFKLNAKWGLLNKQGEILVEAKYDEIGDIRGDTIAVRRGSKWGALDLEGREVVSFIYDSIGRFDSGRAVAKLGSNELYVYSSPETKEAWEQIEENKRQEKIRQARIEEENRQNKLRREEESRRNSLQQEIDSLSREITSVNEKIQREENSISINPNNPYLKTRRNELLDERADLERRLAEKERQRSDVARSSGGTTSEYSQNRMNHVQKEIDDLSREISSVNEKIQREENSISIDPNNPYLKARRNDLLKEKADLERRLREKERERRDISRGF